MIIVKTPLRISLFGGSTDYESYYKENGSFLIGATINKYAYLSMRIRPRILAKESVVVYSKMEFVKSFDEIHNSLIRATLKYKNVNDFIEFFSFSDVPSRTGLGGSSSYCVGLLYLINKLYNLPIDKKELIKDAIQIERIMLKEAGGIQDQIWPAYGGLGSIEIGKDGNFAVRPLPISEEFYHELEDSLVMIYTNEQRGQEEIAKSHESKYKDKLLEISREAYKRFLEENLLSIGELMYESWLEKRDISPLISTRKVDETIKTVMGCGAYGAKLLGAGGCGFVLALCDPEVKKTLKEKFADSILDIKFEKEGVSQIYP